MPSGDQSRFTFLTATLLSIGLIMQTGRSRFLTCIPLTDPGANQPGAVNGGIASLFQMLCQSPAVTDPERSLRRLNGLAVL